jgi:hypothetical protein
MVITTLSTHRDAPTKWNESKTARSTAGLPSERNRTSWIASTSSRSTALCLRRVHDRELHRTAAMVMRCAIHPLDAGVDLRRLLPAPLRRCDRHAGLVLIEAMQAEPSSSKIRIRHRRANGAPRLLQLQLDWCATPGGQLGAPGEGVGAERAGDSARGLVGVVFYQNAHHHRLGARSSPENQAARRSPDPLRQRPG